MRHILVIALVVACLSFLFLGIRGVGGFAIRRVECYTQFGQCDADYATATQFLIGRPIYWPLPRIKLEEAFAARVAVSSLALYRRLPATVVIRLQLRQPIGLVTPTVLGAAALVDDQGIVYSLSENSAFPRLVVDGDLGVGSRLTPSQVEALKLLGRMGGMFPDPVSGRLVGSVLTAQLGTTVEVVIDVGNPIAGWDTSLQLILTRSRINGKNPRKIDLRFTNPTVVY